MIPVSFNQMSQFQSLENTRKVFSVISGFLEFPGGNAQSKKASKNHCGTKVLTSEQSLALLEKARKKRRGKGKMKAQVKRRQSVKK